MKRWPLFLIAAPAAVAVWSGWVGLGALCGFGLVQPFPGIVSWHLDTAITLPVGVEAYGAYALGAWLTPGTPERARTFARRSALGALALGVLGQVIYHLLNAAHAARAPWPVVVLVSCLPVVTLGFGAALTHLLRSDPSHGRDSRFTNGNANSDLALQRESAVGVTGSETPIGAWRNYAKPPGVPEAVPAVPGAHLNGSGLHPDEVQPFADELAHGEVPTIRRIRSELHVGQPKAQEIRARLSVLARTP